MPFPYKQKNARSDCDCDDPCRACVIEGHNSDRACIVHDGFIVFYRDFGIQRVLADSKVDFLSVGYGAFGSFGFDKVVIAERQRVDRESTVLVGVHCLQLTVLAELINAVAGFGYGDRFVVSRKQLPL